MTCLQEHINSAIPNDGTPGHADILVLGLGNTIMTDDGVGPAVADRLLRMPGIPGLRIVDGGTCGLALLSFFEGTGGLIVIDAARSGAPTGTVRTVHGADFDKAATACRGTAHEAALGDLVQAARAARLLPRRRALVTVEAGHIGIGLALTPPVAAAVAETCDKVADLVREWQQ